MHSLPAVYTTIDEGALAHLIPEVYALPTPTVHLVRRGFNDTYRVTTGEATYFLRVYLHAKYYISGPGDLQFELDLLDHLAASGLGVATAIPQRDGSTLGAFQAPEGLRHYALFRGAPGAPASEPTEDQRYAFGAALARIHQVADRFETGLPRQRLDVGALIDASMVRLRPHLLGEDRAFVERVAARTREVLADLPMAPGAWGIIHGDPHDGNCHFDGDSLVFYDFDTCGWGWRGYDLAIAAGGPEAPHRQALLDGYQSVRPLPDWELQALPALLQARVIWDAGDILTMAPIWGESLMGKTIRGMIKELRKLATDSL